MFLDCFPAAFVDNPYSKASIREPLSMMMHVDADSIGISPQGCAADSMAGGAGTSELFGLWSILLAK